MAAQFRWTPWQPVARRGASAALDCDAGGDRPEVGAASRTFPSELDFGSLLPSQLLERQLAALSEFVADILGPQTLSWH